MVAGVVVIFFIPYLSLNSILKILFEERIERKGCSV